MIVAESASRRVHLLIRSSGLGLREMIKEPCIKVSILRNAIALAMMGAGIGGCQADAGERDDNRQISAGLFRVLTSQGKAICVDAATHGEPLAIFRSMIPAPDPARRPLIWSRPAPLENGRTLTGRELVDDEFGDGRLVLPERTSASGVLSVTAQVQLNALARTASMMSSDSSARLNPAPDAPLAKVRWWIRNRFDANCGPPYTVSKPIIMRDVAFVSVTAGHRGSTYAFHKVKAVWQPVAKWSTWLY